MSGAVERHEPGGELGVPIDQAAILKHLKLDPRDPATQALVLVCERYRLDPVLRHMVLIQGAPYITRDGLLHVAHQSGLFDGIEVVDQDETDSHWTATVSVHRKDMGRPITYPGRYPKNGSNKAYGPEMALKVAEVMALRRAFDVTGVAVAEEAWATTDTPAAAPAQGQGDPFADRPALTAAPDTGMPVGREAWELWGRAHHVTVADVKAATRLPDWASVANAPHDRQARIYALADQDDDQ